MLNRFRPVTDADLPDADVVIATWWETAHWIAQLSPEKGAKVYFVQHHEADPTWIGPERVAHAQASYRLPLYPITISQWLVDILRDRYGHSEVAHVPNSFDMRLFSTPPRGRQPRPTVGLLYSPNHFKGVDISLLAIERLRQDRPDLQTIAFGTKPPVPELPLPPGAEFHLRPAQDTIPTLYSRCDVWLCGSRFEGFGLPLVEAMACRTPVVSTPVGIAETYVRDGENGFLVPIGDPQAMADAASRVLSWDDARWRAASEAAHATVSSYTLDEAVDRFEAALVTAVRRDRQDPVPLTHSWGQS
jgi:glycosyltransferase involved in cell wall biosynthesis